MTGLVDLISLRLTGKPLADLSWQELLEVRDEVDRALNVELNRLQAAGDRAGAS